MEFLTQEFIRTISPVRQSVFPLHRLAQLGPGDQRLREGGEEGGGCDRLVRDCVLYNLQ